MMYKYDLRELFPRIYDGVTETDEIARIETEFLADLSDVFSRFFYNTFVRTSNESGVKDWEALLNITAVSQETLEQRKARIFDKLRAVVRYTMPYLLQRLNALLGAGSYTEYMDYGNYRLSIEGNLQGLSSLNFRSLMVELTHILPANILLVLDLNVEAPLSCDIYHAGTLARKYYRKISMQPVDMSEMLGVTWYASAHIRYRIREFTEVENNG